MLPHKKDPRGGPRKGTGPKPCGLNEKEQKSLVKAIKRLAKETGKKPGDILAEIIYNPETKPSNKLKGLELYYRTLMGKNEVVVNTVQGPTIGLPEISQPTVQVEVQKPERLN